MDKEFETYCLAKPWKRISARIIDIIIVSLIPGIISLIWFFLDKSTINSWKSLIIMIIINYVIFIIYFLLIPWKFNGQTIGKKIFKIKLVHQENKKILFKTIFLREIILIFIPVTLIMIGILLTNIFLQNNIGNVSENKIISFWINVLIRIIYSFIFAWYLGIIISIKFDKRHQLFYDYKSAIYIINEKPLLKKPNPQEIKKETDKKFVHIHLGTNQPGNIEKKDLKEINDL